MTKDFVGIATDYANKVISGEIPACKFVIQACQRQLDDLAKPPAGYRFSKDHAERICRFIELAPHIKGPAASRGDLMRLEPWQVFILSTAFGWVDAEGNRRFRRVYVEVPRGNGKALDIRTEIPTPRGMVLMRDIQVGDEVYATDGTVARVSAVTGWLIGRPCYEIEFSTGEVIVADADHQWVTDARRDRDRLKGKGGKHAGPRPSVKTTREIADTLFCRKERNHRVSVTEPISGPERKFTVSPYILGAWLGDGSSASGEFTTADTEMLDAIRAEGETITKARTGEYSYRFSDGDRAFASRSRSLAARLRALGILGDKHIPEEYLTASKPQRLALLQGLMDTDGFISAGQGQCEFTQKSERIARQVYRLIASLGMRPRLMERDVTCNGAPAGKAWRVLFHAYKDTPVFRLSRKADRLRDRPDARGLQDYRTIVRCDPVESRPVKCIEVDAADHCYLATAGHIATHNSSLSSPVGLYMTVLDGEAGAEVYSAATTRDQARIVFRDAQAMARKMEPFRKRFGVDVTAQAIVQLKSSSSFKALSADGHTLDGLNIHCAVVDELHAHKSRDVYDVLETGLGKRPQSLLWMITTAGSNKHGICYEVRDYALKVLSGAMTDAAAEAMFAIVYSVDEGDDPYSEETLRKANPNWGVSVDPNIVMQTAAKARQVATARANYLTKHLNIWVDANSALFDTEWWRKCEDRALDEADFAADECVMGLDLASKIDIAARVNVYRRLIGGKANYYVFPRFYLPRVAIEEDRHPMYRGWEMQGDIYATPGETTDFGIIEDEIKADGPGLNLQAVATDPWQAQQMIQSLKKDGMPAEEYRQTVANMSEATKTLDALMREGRIHHPGNAVLNWMIGNVVGHYDAKENVYPRKEMPQNKIDGAIALIMALGWFIQREAAEPAKEYKMLIF